MLRLYNWNKLLCKACLYSHKLRKVFASFHGFNSFIAPIFYTDVSGGYNLWLYPAAVQIAKQILQRNYFSRSCFNLKKNFTQQNGTNKCLFPVSPPMVTFPWFWLWLFSFDLLKLFPNCRTVFLLHLWFNAMLLFTNSTYCRKTHVIPNYFCIASSYKARN